MYLFIREFLAQTIQTLDSEPMVSSRVRLPYHSLGPAPFPLTIDHLDFQLFGNAHIDKGVMRLTDATQSQRGSVWSKYPLRTPNWQVDLRFQVGGSPNIDHFGDGFAFWVITERGVSGEALGGPDSFHGLGVFFDTFKNENFRAKKQVDGLQRSSRYITWRYRDHSNCNKNNTLCST